EEAPGPPETKSEIKRGVCESRKPPRLLGWPRHGCCSKDLQFLIRQDAIDNNIFHHGLSLNTRGFTRQEDFKLKK
ncbi:MAG TPA: hypothetical protein DHO02_05705, partial [Syntrophaceae bacterium]|nr:hypothetical protein [Syntrophaceae bacterium]